MDRQLYTRCPKCAQRPEATTEPRGIQPLSRPWLVFRMSSRGQNAAGQWLFPQRHRHRKGLDQRLPEDQPPRKGDGSTAVLKSPVRGPTPCSLRRDSWQGSSDSQSVSHCVSHLADHLSHTDAHGFTLRRETTHRLLGHFWGEVVAEEGFEPPTRGL